MKNFGLFSLFALVFGSMIVSCDDHFLDAKPSKSMVIPESIDDIEGLLNGSGTMNLSNMGRLQITIDDLWVPDNIFINRSAFDQLPYLWEDDNINISSDWNTAYATLLTINTVIDLAKSYVSKNQFEERKIQEILGRAYFHRAIKFWYLLQQFSPFYSPDMPDNEFGIILNLSNNVQDRLPRASLKESYDQVFSDLYLAIELLPYESDHVMIANKVAANALMARIFLSINQFDKALEYANTALSRHSTLMDYNEITRTSPTVNPFTRFNAETIYYSQLPTLILDFTISIGGFVDTLLINSYHENDLRFNLFFRSFPNGYQMNGLYSGLFIPFSGLATDELMLIRAESKARLGDVTGAMVDLNMLLETRYRTGTFVPYTIQDQTEAIRLILDERRKQLLSRGLRWTDLRRNNTDPRFAKTLYRNIGGQQYTLQPNDARYTLIIPTIEIELNPQVVQNPR